MAMAYEKPAKTGDFGFIAIIFGAIANNFNFLQSPQKRVSRALTRVPIIDV